MKKHFALLTLLVIAAAFTVGCGVSTPKTTTPQNPIFTKMAFYSDRSTDPATDMFTMNLDGSSLTPITFGTSAWSFSLSADNSTLAFVSEGDLWVGNGDGTSLTQITEDGTVYGARLSPDGTKLVYESNNGTNYHLTVLHSDASPSVDLNATLPEGMSNCYLGSFSADSAKVVFVCWGVDESTFGIYTINVDGTGLATVTTGTWNFLDTPAFSADGTKILFVGYQTAPTAQRPAKATPNRHMSPAQMHQAVRAHAVPGIPGTRGIYSINIDGTGQTSIVPDAFESLVLNSNLFYTTYNSDLDAYQIYKSDLDGSNAVSISDGTADDYVGVYWY